MNLFTMSTLVFIGYFLLLTLPNCIGKRPDPRKPFGPPSLTTPQHHHLHGHSHNPLVTEKYYGRANIIWNCKLNRQPCNLKNSVNFIPFELEYSNNEKEEIVAKLDKAGQIFDGKLPQPVPKLSFKASRLWTNYYFPARYVNACLYLSYTMSGQLRKQMYVMQRNKEDKCIYSAEDMGQASSKWIDAEIQLDLKYGDARFVLDFEYDFPSASADYRTFGAVQIRNFSIAYGNCARNDGNECDFPHLTSNY